jgi:hypothetical protein
MVGQSPVFAEDLPPFEYASPESSSPAVPALQRNDSNKTGDVFVQNVVPPVNPVMDAWRHLSPLNLTDDKAGQASSMLTGENAAKMFIVVSLRFMRQQLQDIVNERKRYEEEKAKKMPTLIDS